MYISRLNFYTLPGKTKEVEERLGRLLEMVVKVGGIRTHVLRSHMARPELPMSYSSKRPRTWLRWKPKSST